MTSNIDLWKWFTQSVSGDTRSARGEAVVIMRNGEGQEQVRFKVHDCLPLKMKAPALNAKEGLLAIEEMQLAYRYFEIEEPQPPFGLSAGIGVSASAGVSAGSMPRNTSRSMCSTMRFMASPPWPAWLDPCPGLRPAP